MAENGPSRWLFVVSATAVGCLLTLALIATVLYWFVDWQGQPHLEPQAQSLPHYTRTEFTDLVLGKPEHAVLEEVGRPDKTSQDKQAEYWHYHNRTKDPVTGQTDTDVQVVLQDGKVVTINY